MNNEKVCNMIIISFGCGLGNQMFEYAFYLSMKNAYPNVRIKADVRYALPIEHNGYELERIFGIKMEESTLREVLKYSEYIPKKKRYFLLKVWRFIRKRLGRVKKSFYLQRDYTEFYSDVYKLDAEKNYYLLGIWGNEKYFAKIGNILRNDIFVFPIERLNCRSKEYKEMIESSQTSISIHIRKGDFIQYENPILSRVYYEKAMKIVCERYINIRYFIFSDDEMYARELLTGVDNVVFIDGNQGNDSWMDMYLMSICKHNIIANSSFSFWGAYLNRNIDKLVIAPNLPFRNCKNAFTCKDWIILKTG